MVILMFLRWYVIIKSMPGHTPGHQVLYVNLGKANIIDWRFVPYYEIENTNVYLVSIRCDQTKKYGAFEAFAKKRMQSVFTAPKRRF